MPETDGAPANRMDRAVPGHAGNALVDDLARWREQLARSIARNNVGMQSEAIATAVNRAVFTFLFVTAAEDRHLLPAGTLADLKDHPEDRILPGVTGPFADGIYAGVFPDARALPQPETPVIGDRIVHGILTDIASPKRQYDLSRLPAESLGHVLARYLARTVRQSAAHHAVIAHTHDTVLSGITVIPPLVLIRAVSDQALEAVRKKRSKREVLPIRILDPACGSGALLAAAYRHLSEKAAGQPLTFEERREILADSIHGLDISPHAVAATRMLLALEFLEGHRLCRDYQELLLLIQPVLRDLGYTILCGNALVGPEIHQDESWNFCPPWKRHALNPFLWGDHFTEIHAAGGFDLVVCNPPEGPVEPHEWIQQYFQRRYSVYHRTTDRSAYFIERGLSLLRPGGTLAFVMQSRWLRAAGGSPLRSLLMQRKIEEIADYPGTGLCSIRIRNQKPSGPFTFVKAEIADTSDRTGRIAITESFPVDPASLDQGGWTFRDTRTATILAKMQESGTPVGVFCMGESGFGSLRRADERLFISREKRDRLVKKDRRANDFLRPFVEGTELGRYHGKSTGKFLLLIPPPQVSGAADEKRSGSRFRKLPPAVAVLLNSLAPESAATAEGTAPWYDTGCRDEFLSKDRPKILFPARSIVPVFTADDGRSLVERDTGYLVTGSLFLLAVLNSRLARFWFMHRQQPVEMHQARDTASAVAGFYIHVPDLDDVIQAGWQARIETLARRMLVYHDQLARGGDETERDSIRKKIEQTDRQIDSLVYGLYGLTADEIAVVETSSS